MKVFSHCDIRLWTLWYDRPKLFVQLAQGKLHIHVGILLRQYDCKIRWSTAPQQQWWNCVMKSSKPILQQSADLVISIRTRLRILVASYVITINFICRLDSQSTHQPIAISSHTAYSNERTRGSQHQILRQHKRSAGTLNGSSPGRRHLASRWSQWSLSIIRK